MQLHAVLFAGQLGRMHARLADVLRISAAENSPNTPLTIHEITEADPDLREIAHRGTKRPWLDNARKAKHQHEIVNQAERGDVLGMLDTDTMVLGDLSEIDGMEFDLAYTVRPAGSRWILNTGVYFVRVSNEAKRFVGRWRAMVYRMLADPALHQHWKKYKHYGGIHQAALGWMLENDDLRIRCLGLPCAEWNCVSGMWDTVENPKIVHVMIQMRDWCTSGRKPKTEGELRLVERWKEYDGRARKPAIAG